MNHPTTRVKGYELASRQAYRTRRQTGRLPSAARLAHIARVPMETARIVLADIRIFDLALEGLQLTLMGRAEHARRGQPIGGYAGAGVASKLETLADSLADVPAELAEQYQQACQLDDQEPPIMRRIESAMIEAVIEGKPMPNATAFIARALRLLERVHEQQQGQSPTVH